MRDKLERGQIPIYLGAMATAAAVAWLLPALPMLEHTITPALAVMLYATFLQVPLTSLGRMLGRGRFLAALLTANFVGVPLLVALLVPFLPADPMIRLGVLLVLLTPCIDYVITFAHLGRADAGLLLASTPVLLIVQMLLLPGYLKIFHGDAADLMRWAPFVHAFVWLIAVPLALAAITQLAAARNLLPPRITAVLSLLPVPSTALVLFLVIASTLPQLQSVAHTLWPVIPVYIAFALAAPLLGWLVGRIFRLEARAGRALAFSTGTRNSLVILPLALAVPGALPVLPAVIVTQTLVELLSELVYVRGIARLGARRSAQ